MVDSEEFPLDPNFTKDCFWDAVNRIESQHQTKKEKKETWPSSAPNTNIAAKPRPKQPKQPLSNGSNNINTSRNKYKPSIRPRSNSSSSTSSNTSSTSTLSGSSSTSSKRKKFKCPKPKNENTQYFKDYTNKYKGKKLKTSLSNNSINNNKRGAPRSRNPLLLSQTNHNKNITINDSLPFNNQRIESNLDKNNISNTKLIQNKNNGSHQKIMDNKQIESMQHSMSQNKPKYNTINSNSISNGNSNNHSSSNNTPSILKNSNNSNNSSYSSYNSNTSSFHRDNQFSASCSADSISRINASNTSQISVGSKPSQFKLQHDSDGFAIPRSRAKTPMKSKKSQSNHIKKSQYNNTKQSQSKQSQSDIDINTRKIQELTAKIIESNKKCALLRRDKRRTEEALQAEVETYKRRSNDFENESRKLQQMNREYKNQHNNKYDKQFQTLKRQKMEMEQQRNAKEHELKSLSNKNRELKMKFLKQEEKTKKLRIEYKKLFNTLEQNKKRNNELTQQLVQLKSSDNIHIVNHIESTPKNIASQRASSQSVPIHNKKNSRKRKLDETENHNINSGNLENVKCHLFCSMNLIGIINFIELLFFVAFLAKKEDEIKS